MINSEQRIAIAREVARMSSEELLAKFKEVDRLCRATVTELVSYRSDETYETARTLSENEYIRTIIVDRIIGKAIV